MNRLGSPVEVVFQQPASRPAGRIPRPEKRRRTRCQDDLARHERDLRCSKNDGQITGSSQRQDLCITRWHKAPKRVRQTRSTFPLVFTQSYVILTRAFHLNIRTKLDLCRIHQITYPDLLLSSNKVPEDFSTHSWIQYGSSNSDIRRPTRELHGSNYHFQDLQQQD